MPRPGSRPPDLWRERPVAAQAAAEQLAELWIAEVAINHRLRKALTKAEAFVADFEDDHGPAGVTALLTEMRAALADDPRSQPSSKPSRVEDLALFALFPLTVAAIGGVIWMHLQ